MFRVSAEDILDASSVQMILGNPKVQQYSTSLLQIVSANISRRGKKRVNLLYIHMMLNIYFSPVVAGCMYRMSMLKASLGKRGMILFSAATSGKYRVISKNF